MGASMNPYLENLEKIEFVVTYACTGRCRHCSEGDHTAHGGAIDPQVAADAVRRIAAAYSIRTVMTFGGEPLLYPDIVASVMCAAREVGVSRRQVITNGCFTRDLDRIRTVARQLAECGVNDLLLSVDAFHQETLPLQTVMAFADAAIACGIPLLLSPAWLVGEGADNHYNRKTRALLACFADRGIPVGAGNVIFPSGNACRYLAEYFVGDIPENPYAEAPHNVRCVSFSPNGDVLGDNVYRRDIMEILSRYLP